MPLRWLSPTLSPSAQSAIRGVLLTILACALFAVLDSATKFIGKLLPVLMVLWLRFMAQALVTSVLVLPRLGLPALKTRNLKFQLLRAISGLLTTVCAFFCIQNMPLANFTAIWSAAPLFIVVASALFFKEQVSPSRWALLVIGLLAVVAIVRPENDGQALGLAALWPAGLLVSGTTYQVLGSRLSRLDSPPTTQLYSTWLPLLLTTPLVGLVWQPIDHWQIYAAAAVMGLCSGIGHLMLLQAYTHATPATVAPFLYSQIGFAMLLGWLFFGQLPDHISLVGMAVVTLSGMMGVWIGIREKR
ncbi:DMT family transporter [uncultured Comamonas sp.]|uniref:DMT family transporter n=1 Tax=uncultured Comamonas sp. TaxID=114710 RepID=UPI0025FEE928|nr:DMT family transporter [uncultured Comamonas sp.]